MHISPIYLQIYQKATNTLEDGAKLKLALPKQLNKVYIFPSYLQMPVCTKCAWILKQCWPL